MRTVLFVCTGNTCRSPMAEAIARDAWEADGDTDSDEVFFASAGVGAAAGVPTSLQTLEALRSLGIEYEGRSTPLTSEMIRKADLVLCMTAGHAAAARDISAGADNDHKIHRLDPNGDVSDPIGLGQVAYDDLARRLADLIPRRLKELLDS